MSAVPPVDIDQLRTWVGRKQTAEQTLDLFPARALAGLLDCEVQPRHGDALPLTWQWLYFLEIPNRSALGVDGHPQRGGFLPPVPLPRRMWAAGRLIPSQALVLGEHTVKTSTVRSLDQKQGRSGTVVFVSIEHRFEQQGVCCLTEVQDLVYREAIPAATGPQAGEAAHKEHDWQRHMIPDGRLLFRYSALTYNGHRIHYDTSYARAVESYPDLVVHGPLQATLLMHLFGLKQPSARIEHFSFRAHRPAFVDQPLHLTGRVEGNVAELWTANNAGELCMRVEVSMRPAREPQ